MKSILFVIASLISFNCCHVCAEPANRPFIVTQSMYYKGGVDIASYGVLRNPIIYEVKLLPQKDSDSPLQGSDFEELAAKLEKGPLPTVIDIERWTIYTKDKIKRAENLRKFLDIVEKLRALRPDIQFGYYDVVPQRMYWMFSNPKEQEARDEWQMLNHMAKIDFVPHVDAIFPSLYTLYDDPKKWELNAKVTLQAARQFNKPVYCFLWPQYHFGNKDHKGEYLPTKYWRLQLETCRRYGDGIVIWNYEPDKAWDEDALWWRETVTFLKTYN